MFLNQINFRYMVSILEVQKNLTDLAQTLKNIHVHITNILALCYKEKGEYNTCQNLKLICTNTNQPNSYIRVIYSIFCQSSTLKRIYILWVLLQRGCYYRVGEMFGSYNAHYICTTSDRLMHFDLFAQRKRKYIKLLPY